MEVMSNITKRLSDLRVKATKGKWSHYDDGFTAGVVSNQRKAYNNEHSSFNCGKVYEKFIFGGDSAEGYIDNNADVQLIVETINALPKLLEIIRIQSEALKQVKGYCMTFPILHKCFKDHPETETLFSVAEQALQEIRRIEDES